jgi:hypothetical protein
MIRAKTCFVAEGVSIDRETNLVSAFGLMESVQAAAFPVMLQKVVLLCIWERSPADPPEFRYELALTLNGRELERRSIDTGFGNALRTRTTIRFEGLTLAEPGNLVFRLAVREHGVAEWGMTATAAPQAVPGAVGAAGRSHVYDSGQISVSVGSTNGNRR